MTDPKEKRDNLFGVFALITLIIVNIFALLIFLASLSEQIRTGWGYGTDLELGALVVWGSQVFLFFPWISGTVLTVLSIIHKDKKGRSIANTVLIFTALLLTFFADLFMFV